MSDGVVARILGRRLGMASPDPWREGWNRALEVAADDIRLGLRTELTDAREAIAHLEAVSLNLSRQGDVAQVLLSEDGVSQAHSLADELWLIAYNLRAALEDR